MIFLSNKHIEPKRLIISGMMRSGTTLIQKALSAHPEIDIEYQSRTNQLIGIKKLFLEGLGRENYHVLSHYNPSKGYKFQDFFEWQASQEAVRGQIFSGLECSDSLVVGVKEVLAEEFYPKLLEEGVYCLNIIRDPRDVIASMSFGHGSEFTGKPRPVLFDLRNWRKSVHFSLRLKESDSFKTIIFEDLIGDPDKVLGKLFDWLKVSKLPAKHVDNKMKENKWNGNSSFGNKRPFDRSVIGGYKSILPLSTISFIDAVCFPEMDWAGYKLDNTELDIISTIRNYRDPFPIERDEFDQDYSFSPNNIDYELNRVGKNIFHLNEEFFND